MRLVIKSLLLEAALHAGEPHGVAEVTLVGRRRCKSAVGGEDTVVDQPGGGVELGEEGLNAETEAVLGVGNGLEDSCANDGLVRLLVIVYLWRKGIVRCRLTIAACSLG